MTTMSILAPKSGGDSIKRGSVYDQITDRIIGLLESGTAPWRKPWSSQSGLPRNLVSNKAYRGINVLLLHAMSYESPYWLTYRQALELGGNVRKGEKACPVVFWKQLQVENKKNGEPGRIPLLRYYYCFNVAQCDGLEKVSVPGIQTPMSPPTKPDEIVAFMPNRPEIKHGMRKAYYSPAEDIIALPDRNRFDSEAGYHATLFHELVHSTGHKSRLNRPTLTESAGFGSNLYCKEELIAEMGAAFLCGMAGISDNTLDSSAAYLRGWLEPLHQDKNLIVQAAAQAQRATDYILGVKHDDSPAPTTDS